MFQLHCKRTSLITVLAIVLVAPTGSLAQQFSDRDSHEISSYVLTEAGLAKFSQATRSLSATAKRSLSACDDEDGPTSLDAAVARVNAAPGAQAAIKSAGMTTREYIVFTFSVFQNGMAAWALGQPGGKLPPGASMANVNFYRAHEAAIQKLGLQSKSDDCDKADSG